MGTLTCGSPYNSNTNVNSTYAAFIALMSVGLILGLFICDADKVIREDGTKVLGPEAIISMVTD
jgi:hypothetical protein